MIVNGQSLLRLAPILGMVDTKLTDGNVSYGLGEAGYDIRIKQTIRFNHKGNYSVEVFECGQDMYPNRIEPKLFGKRLSNKVGRFCLASTVEEFVMPECVTGIVHDKSTWARRGLSVFNTVIEPGWNGFLTLELVYHGEDELIIPAGSGIAQVVFHSTTDLVAYSGKYQNQEDEPVFARKA